MSKMGILSMVLSFVLIAGCCSSMTTEAQFVKTKPNFRVIPLTCVVTPPVGALGAQVFPPEVVQVYFDLEVSGFALDPSKWSVQWFDNTFSVSEIHQESATTLLMTVDGALQGDPTPQCKVIYSGDPDLFYDLIPVQPFDCVLTK